PRVLRLGGEVAHHAVPAGLAVSTEGLVPFRPLPRRFQACASPMRWVALSAPVSAISFLICGRTSACAIPAARAMSGVSGYFAYARSNRRAAAVSWGALAGAGGGATCSLSSTAFARAGRPDRLVIWNFRPMLATWLANVPVLMPSSRAPWMLDAPATRRS